MALVKKFEQKYELKISQLPENIINKLKLAHKYISDEVTKAYNELKDESLSDFIKTFTSSLQTSSKSVELYKIKQIIGYKFECMIQLMKHYELPKDDKKLSNKIHSFVKKIFNRVKPAINKEFGYKLDNENDSNNEPFEGFDIYPDSKTCKRIYDELMKTKVITEATPSIPDPAIIGDKISKRINKHVEKTNKHLEDVRKDLEEQSKKLASKKVSKKDNESVKKLQLIGKNIIESKKISSAQVTIIKNELITLFLKDSNLENKIHTEKFKLSIDDSKKVPFFEFNIGKISNDFLSKIFNSKADLYDFILESNLSMKVSSALILSIKDPNDLYNFFNFVFKTYVQKTLPKICQTIQKNFVNLNSVTKELLSETDMKSIFLLILHQSLVFTNISLTDLKGLSDNTSNVQKTMKWAFDLMKNLNKDNKKSIMDEINTTLKHYKEHATYTDIYSSISKLSSILESFFNGSYDNIIERNHNQLLHRSIDHKDSDNYDVKVMVEKYNILKLKKIDINEIDKYKCLLETTLNPLSVASELIPIIEQVDWYIQLLDKNSAAYIIPQNKPELVKIQSNLKDLYKKALGIKSDKDIQINGIIL